MSPTFIPMAEDGEHDIVTALGLANFTCGEWRGGNPDDPSYAIHLEAAEASEQAVRDFIYGIQEQLETLRAENEGFRTRSDMQFQATYFDLRETLGLKPGGSVIEAVDTLLGNLAARTAQLKRTAEALEELVTVADLRGDAELPHPSDDPKLWTARMQAAWDEARELVCEHRAAAPEQVSGNTLDELHANFARRIERAISAWTSDGQPITVKDLLAAMKEQP